MLKKIVCYVVSVCVTVSMFSVCLTGFAATSNDGAVYTDTWIPGTDNGQSGDINKLSVSTSSEDGESFYVYTSLTGAADAPLIYRQRTTALNEMTFMLTEASSSVGYYPVFYDKNKGASGGENWSQMMTISPNGGVVIANISDSSSQKIFMGEESGWENDKYTLIDSVAVNKKHTIRVEHDPDNLRFTLRFDGHSVTLAENPSSAYVLSAKTGSPDVHNAKGPRFTFKAASGKSFRVYDLYIRATQATNTSAAETAKVFSGARAYTYPGELKVTETTPSNDSYGTKADEKDVSIKFNQTLSESQNDFVINIAYSSDDDEYAEVSPDDYTYSFAPSDSMLNISFLANLKRGVKYRINIENVYSFEENSLTSYTLYFNTDDGTAEIIESVNSATGLRNLGTALNEYKSDIGLDEADYTNVADNRNVLSWIYSKKPYNLVSEIKTVADMATALKTTLDSVTESGIDAFVDLYHTDLFADQSAYEKYDALSLVHKAMADNMIASGIPFNTLIDFVDAFETSVNSISEDSPAMRESGDKLICDFTKTGTTGWNPSKSDYSFINEATPDFASGVTLGHYYIPETTTNQYRMDYDIAFSDVSDCEALYIWAYSPVASGKQFALVPFCTDSPSWVYFSKLVTIDFSGWKLITIPLSSFGATRSPSWSNIREIRIAQAGMGLTEAVGGTEIYFAKMWFGAKMTADSLTLINSNAQNGTQNFGTADTLEYEFSGQVYFNPANAPYIVDADGNRVNADVSANGNTLFINPAESLAPNSVYTVHPVNICTYGGVEYSSSPITFTTAANGLSAGVPTFSVFDLPESGSVSVAAELGNTHSSAIDAELIVAAYDKDGRMTGMSSKEYTIGAGESGKTAVCTITLPSYSGVTLKAFVINKTDNNKPVNQKIGALKSSDALPDKAYPSFDKPEKFEDGNLTIKNISVNNNKIIVESCMRENVSTPLTIKVSDSMDNIKYISQTSTDPLGCNTVELSLNPDFDESGKYKIEISSASMTNLSPASGYFYYINSTDRASVLGSINSASSESGVASLLNANKELMSVLDVDYTKDENTYISHIIFRDKPYTTYTEVIEKYQKAVAALSAVNSAYWSSYTDVLGQNKDIIFDSTDVYDEYMSLGASEKNKVSQNVYAKRPFKSFDAFVNAISDEMTSGESSGGSSGGGASAPSSPKGGYSTGASGGTNAAPTVPNQDLYTDLAGCEWAKDYIYSLKNKGVLTMGADRKFRPADNITREEYVKMLVLSLGIANGGDAYFDDVSKDAWYYTYIAAAYSRGIVNGVEKNRFGIGEYITREQMAAMACRALGISETEIAVSEVFADDGEISAYAKDSVYYMQSKGIINGIGGNLFAPKANASRAQAAKIVSMISAL